MSTSGIVSAGTSATAIAVARQTAKGSNSRVSSILTKRNLSLLVGTVAVLGFVYRYRDFLLNKERVQEEALQLLSKLKGDDEEDPFRSLATYASGMAAWEFFGLSTIPVETAAGMVFGWQAAPASFAGKLLGALSSFVVGRVLLAERARSKLQNNELFQQLLREERALERKAIGDPPIRWQSHPITTAFLMKFSCFPELVKNIGSSLLSAVSIPTFVLATLVHGGMFTVLWTWWGVETAARLQDTDYPASQALRAALVCAAFLGVVISPLLMAWWIRDLKRQDDAKRKK